jgi:senataxin
MMINIYIKKVDSRAIIMAESTTRSSQVKKIPKTFASLEHYLDSFADPLVEEVHADVLSSFEGYHQAPFVQVTGIQELDRGKKSTFFCFLAAKSSRETSYTPTKDDIVAVSSRKSKHLSSYVLGSVCKSGEDDEDFPADCFIVRLLSAPPVEVDAETKKPMAPLFVSFLMNTKTYNRIWTCLQLGKTSGGKRRSDASLVDAIWRYSTSKVRWLNFFDMHKSYFFSKMMHKSYRIKTQKVIILHH